MIPCIDISFSHSKGGNNHPKFQKRVEVEFAFPQNGTYEYFHSFGLLLSMWLHGLSFLPRVRGRPIVTGFEDWLKRAGTSFQPIRSTTKIWVVTRHQYGISALVTQTSFCEGSSGDLAKRQLFSQAKNLCALQGYIFNSQFCKQWRNSYKKNPFQCKKFKQAIKKHERSGF